MAENSESIPQLEVGSLNDVPEQSETDLQPSEKSTSESCKSGTGRVAAVKSDVNIKKTRSSANSGAVPGSLSAKEIKEINILLKDLSLLSQRSLLHNCLHDIPPRDVSDVVRELTHTTHFSFLRCKLMQFSMQKAVIVGKERMDNALQIAEVAESNKAAIYRALADKYDAAIKLATRRIKQLEVAAKSARKAMNAAKDVISQKTEVSDETSNASSWILALQRAGNVEHRANILAVKTLYVSLKTMRTCWEDLDPELVETAGLPTRNSREQFEFKRKKSSSLNASIILNSFIGCVVIVNARSRNIPLPYFSLRFALEAISVGHLLYKTVMFCSEKLRLWKIEEIISNIDEGLHILDEIFGNYSVWPGQSDIELNEPNPQDPMELAP